MGSAVDSTTFRKLGEDIGAEADVMRELIDTFLGEGPRIVANIVAGVRAGRVTDVNRGAHSLKSTAATFGASRLSQLCRDLEHETERALPPDAQARAEAIAAEWSRVAAELQTLRP